MVVHCLMADKVPQGNGRACVTAVTFARSTFVVLSRAGIFLTRKSGHCIVPTHKSGPQAWAQVATAHGLCFPPQAGECPSRENPHR